MASRQLRFVDFQQTDLYGTLKLCNNNNNNNNNRKKQKKFSHQNAVPTFRH